MAFTVISALTSTKVDLASGHQYLLLEGVTHFTASTTLEVAINATSADVHILGSLVSLSFLHPIELNNASSVTVTVGASGSIISNTDWRPINSSGNNVRVINNGQITGGQTELDGPLATFINTGVLSGTSGSEPSAALQMQGANASVINSGTMQSTSGRVITFESSATVTNSGEILGAANAIHASLLSISEVLTVSNTGLISAEASAILAGAGNDVVENSGTIIGDVVLNSGNDDYRATADGSVLGLVDGGSGDDTLSGGSAEDAFDGGNDNDFLRGRGGDDTLSGGADDDTLQGGDGDDDLYGDAGNDGLRGGEGDDVLEGGADNDVLSGNNGADELYGDEGEDNLKGGNGDDTLDGGDDGDTLAGNDGNDNMFGGLGDDVLKGGNGEDFMVGGDGRDIMTGGADADTFKFEALSDSGTGGDRDQIRGFTVGEDLIDLRDISADVIAFLDTDPFSATGVAELRLTTTGAGYTQVNVDEDGDGSTDFQIQIRDLVGVLTEDAFSL